MFVPGCWKPTPPLAQGSVPTSSPELPSRQGNIAIKARKIIRSSMCNPASQKGLLFPEHKQTNCTKFKFGVTIYIFQAKCEARRRSVCSKEALWQAYQLQSSCTTQLDSEMIPQNFVLLSKSSFRQIGDAFWKDICKKEETQVQQECAGDASLKGEPSHPKKQGLLIHWGNKDPREPGKNKQVLLGSELFFRIPWQATSHSAL